MFQTRSLSHLVESDSRGNLNVVLPDHVRQNHRADALEFARDGHAGGEFAAAVNAVGIAPVDLRLLAVEKGNPHGVGPFFAPQRSRAISSIRPVDEPAIVRADEIFDVARGVVVRQQQDNSLPRAGNFGDDVPHLHIADGRLGMEGVFVHGAAETLQLRCECNPECGE